MNSISKQAAYNTRQSVMIACLAMIAFAANSILCRIALKDQAVDALSFTFIRLLSGAVILGAINLYLTKKNRSRSYSSKNPAFNLRSYLAAIALTVYAFSFSIAYFDLSTATGALILFASVQVTMLSVSIYKGHRPSKNQYIGLIIAFSGFVYLLSPGLGRPPVIPAFIMTVSGIAWGLYTLAGHGSTQALRDSSQNFGRSLPIGFGILLIAFAFDFNYHISIQGTLLAIASGAIASGIGYALWYAVLPKLGSIQASVMQLSVPILAAIGGLMFAQELPSLQQAIAFSMVLCGIFIVLDLKQKKHSKIS